MNDSQPAIQTAGLGKRYGSVWALRECSITVPPASITALVGPNGAGKSTLLQLLSGLNTPSSGSARVFSGSPEQTSSFLERVSFLAQEIPLYDQLSAMDYLALGAHLNTRWDSASMRHRLEALHIRLDQPVGTLSGGQRAQVALAMALAKQPRLLLMDEPVAALDPLARRDFLASLAEAVADTGLTVVMSSHLLADLEMICDRLIIMIDARVELSDDIERVLSSHGVLVGPRAALTAFDGSDVEVIHASHAPRQSTAIVRFADAAAKPQGMQFREATLEDIVLAYMSRAGQNTQQGGTA